MVVAILHEAAAVLARRLPGGRWLPEPQWHFTLKFIGETPAETVAGNWAFDITPARLVTALITERGLCEASRAGLRAALVSAGAKVHAGAVEDILPFLPSCDAIIVDDKETGERLYPED